VPGGFQIPGVGTRGRKLQVSAGEGSGGGFAMGELIVTRFRGVVGEGRKGGDGALWTD